MEARLGPHPRRNIALFILGGVLVTGGVWFFMDLATGTAATFSDLGVPG